MTDSPQKRSVTAPLVLAAVVFLATAIFPAIVAAQSCPLCYGQAVRSSSQLLAAFRSGILALIIPPMFMSVGITYLAYRKRNQFHEEDLGDNRPLPPE
jgi:hypothetical protein